MRLNIESEVLSYLPTITNVDRWSVKNLTWLFSEVNFQIPFSSLCLIAFHLPLCPSSLRMIFHVGNDKIIFATWGIWTSSFPFGCILVPISFISGLKSNSSSSKMSDLEGLCASSFKPIGNASCTGVLSLIVNISTPVFSKITCPGAIHSKFSARVAALPKSKEYSLIYKIIYIYICMYVYIYIPVYIIQIKVTKGTRIVLYNEGAFTNAYVVKLLCCWVHMDFNINMFRRPTWLAHSSVILHTNCRQKFESYTKTTWSVFLCSLV